MTLTARQVAQIYEARKREQSPWASMARQIRDTYNGDIALPLPEIDKYEAPAVANLTFQGIDQLSMRISSTMPDVYYPPMRPGIKGSEQRARDRRLVTLAWWDLDRLAIKMKKRARHLIAYGKAPVIIRPDTDKGHPCRYVRDPLSTYPARMQVGDVRPEDCIFAYQRRLAWLRDYYPMAYVQLNKPRTSTPDDLFELLEYVDGEQYMLLAVGEKNTPNVGSSNPSGEAVVLEQTIHDLGICMAVVPEAVTLDRLKGRFDGIQGMYVMQSALMSLEYIGMKRAVFPERWFIGNANGDTPKIVQYAQPNQGLPGIIEGGATVQDLRIDPSQLGTMMVDRLERNARVEAQLPAEFGGESTGNIRTGRRGDAVLSAAIDFPIQEAQTLFQVALEEENKVAIAIDKKYFNTSKTFYVSATKGRVEYKPDELWEEGSDVHTVRYAQAGTDINNLIIAIGQRVGLGEMSKLSAMEIDPMIEDPKQEQDRILVESLRDSLLASIQQRASQDPGFGIAVAKLAQRVVSGDIAIEDAYVELDKEYSQAQAGQQQMPPDQMAAQQAPGLGAPGGGGMAPDASVQPPEPSMDNLNMMLRTLRGSSRPIVAA